MLPIKNLLIAAALTLAIVAGVTKSSTADETFHKIFNFSVYSPTYSKTINLGEFTGIALAVPMDVTVELNQKEAIRIEGDEEAIEDLTVEVIGNNLVIKSKESWKVWNKMHFYKKLKAYVSAKSLQAISLSGSGQIKVLDDIKSKNLNINISGSGRVITKAQVNHLQCSISGSGSLSHSGEAKNAHIVISGAGNVNMQVSDKLDAVISGSGSIYYTGNPHIQKRIVGSGGVNKR